MIPTPLRLDDETVKRLDRLASIMAERSAGVRVPRSNVLRVALDRGIESLEAELGVTKKRKRQK